MLSTFARFALRPLARLALAPLALAAALALAPAVRADGSRSVPAARLDVEHGVSVLVLDGATSRERGIQQGQALAPRILEAAAELEGLRRKRIPDRARYEAMLAKFVWDEESKAEIDGILEGALAALGDAATVPGTDRKLSRGDIEGINTLCDFLPFACSSFTIAGATVAGGGTLTARNLDYPAFKSALANHLIVVRPALGKSHGWATVSWPGVVGCYTGMNDEGVTASIHDVRTGPESLLRDGFTPRALGLRAILETVGKGSGWVDRAANVLRKRPVVFGNNIHVSAPQGAGNDVPGAVLEWDPSREKEDGVTVRTSPAGEPLVCTNHWRLRKDPIACPRFAALEKVLAEGKSLTPEGALESLRASAVSGRVVTIHSVVFQLETRRLLVAFAPDPEHAAASEAGVSIDLGSRFDATRAPSAKRWY